MAATLILADLAAKAKACSWVRNAPEHTVVTFKKPGRTLPQNDRMWAMLTDIARQVQHNGARYTPDQWKQLAMHACNHEVHFMAGLNGEPFPAGFRSSKLSAEQMSELIEFLFAFGAEKKVVWSNEPDE